MPNMYAEYLTNYTTYTAKFGPKVAIFLMVGIFYEMYDERDTETGQTKTTMAEIVDLLGLKVSVKQGDGPSGTKYDGLVAGIPDHTVHKWAGRLTQLGWTVVLIEQVKNVAGKVTGRKVERILTPGSHIESSPEADTYLTFVTITGASSSAPPTVAAVSIDLATGHLHVFETQISGEEAWTSNDLVQFMELYPPKEVLWSCQGSKAFVDSLTEAKLKGVFGCRPETTFHQRPHLGSGAWLNPVYREEYLRTRCGLKTLLPTHVALYMRPGSASETALISLLNALEELWPSMHLGTVLVFPWIPGQQMRLGENALVQLHMLVQSDSRQDVLGLFDHCITAMGRRGIRERLLKPSADGHQIQANLDAVDAWLQKRTDYRTAIQRRQRTIVDMDRLYRRIQQGIAGALDLVGLDNSLKALEFIATSEGATEILEAIGRIKTAAAGVFDMAKAYAASDDTGLFIGGLVPQIDQYEEQIQAQMGLVNKWIEKRAADISVSVDTFKPEFRERSLIVKAPRAAVQALKMSGKLPLNTTAVANKSAAHLESAELDQIYLIICRVRESLKKRQAVALVEQGRALTLEIFDDWHCVTDWITKVDVNLTLATIAAKMGYVKPEIVKGDVADQSSVLIEGLRHPLLEAQDRKIPYVQHSVSLGVPGSQGWLLYGLNASGKSTMMRATGLAVLLAQGGSFVPATKMVLAPFQSLHTRIINTDNLWMGLSSFAVEMSEMREIFREAGARSLVLGDELCSGTETVSATALVAAGIKGLIERGARFLFATHLHGLTDIKEVVEDPALKIWHLHVEYDRVKDKLVYHRILKAGSGSSLYGLEVAKAMRIPTDILENAIRFRKRLAGEAELSESVGSAWNSAVVRRACQKCGSLEVASLEVHHIRERARGTGDGSNIHALANLAVLCDKCHDAVHRAGLQVGPQIQTSEGPEESIVSETTASASASASAKSKWSEEERTTISNVCATMGHLTNGNLSKYLLNNYGISISAVSLKRFR
jgi:DNA mismatch repair protein MutS